MFSKVCNLSDNERIIRLAFGLSLIILALYTLDGGARVLVIFLATMGVVTGLFKYDPIYDLLNLSPKKSVYHHKKAKKSRRR